MSLDELISIERVEFEFERSRIQETYSVNSLLLSKLLEELITETKKDILPILDIYISCLKHCNLFRLLMRQNPGDDFFFRVTYLGPKSVKERH